MLSAPDPVAIHLISECLYQTNRSPGICSGFFWALSQGFFLGFTDVCKKGLFWFDIECSRAGLHLGYLFQHSYASVFANFRKPLPVVSALLQH